MAGFKKRKPVSKATDHLKEEGTTSIPHNTAVNVQSISTQRLSINPENTRRTFKSLEALDQFLAEIDWPMELLKNSSSADDSDSIGPLQWIESLSNERKDERLEWLSRIVELALDIQKQGQLQPALGYESTSGYQIITGSTRTLACHLLKQPVEVKLTGFDNYLSELRAHLAENRVRTDLTFEEELRANVNLFKALLEQKEIPHISISVVMRELNIAKTSAARWTTILKAAIDDESELERLASQSSSVRAASDLLTGESGQYLDNNTPGGEINPSATKQTSGLSAKDYPLVDDETFAKELEKHRNKKSYNTLKKVEWKGAQKDLPLITRWATNLLYSEYDAARRAGDTEKIDVLKNYILTKTPIMNREMATAATDFLATLLGDVTETDNNRYFVQRMSELDLNRE